MRSEASRRVNSWTIQEKELIPSELMPMSLSFMSRVRSPRSTREEARISLSWSLDPLERRGRGGRRKDQLCENHAVPSVSSATDLLTAMASSQISTWWRPIWSRSDSSTTLWKMSDARLASSLSLRATCPTLIGGTVDRPVEDDPHPMPIVEQ